jgi:flavin-dependent dehydrogenase
MISPEPRVVVCGAGPAGCVFARDLARAGVKVTIIERKKYSDIGHNFSDLVERKVLEEIGFKVPMEETKINIGPLVKGPNAERGLFEQLAPSVVQIWSPDYGCQKTIQLNYIETDRRVLNQMLLEQAIDAGVEVLCEYEILDLNVIGLGSLDRVNVMGLKVKNLINGKQFDLTAKLTVDASGSRSFLRERLPSSSGIAGRLKDNDFIQVYRTIREINVSSHKDDELQEHIRYGYDGERSWLYFYNNREVEIGASTRGDLDSASPKAIAENYIAKHPALSPRVVGEGDGKLSIGVSPYSLVTNGFLAIGDAACQSNPITGYGIGGAMIGAKLAAKIVGQLSKLGIFDISTLWPYNWLWFADIKRGAHYAALSILHRTIRNLSNDDITFLFKEDILNVETLEPAFNGIFDAPRITEKIKSLLKGMTRPAVLTRLNAGIMQGKKIFNHYLKYPTHWDAVAFEKWVATTQKLLIG